MTVEEIRAMNKTDLLEYSRSKGGEFMRRALENKKLKEIAKK